MLSSNAALKSERFISSIWLVHICLKFIAYSIRLTGCVYILFWLLFRLVWLFYMLLSANGVAEPPPPIDLSHNGALSRTRARWTSAQAGGDICRAADSTDDSELGFDRNCQAKTFQPGRN